MPKADAELAPLFEHYKLPTPRSVMQLQSPLTTLVMIARTDILVLLPIQWVGCQLWTDDVQTIPIREVLPAPAIGIVRRSSLPLTPAAEYFTDMIRRVAGTLEKSTKSAGSSAIRRQARQRNC